jgi:hypothetical protein
VDDDWEKSYLFNRYFSSQSSIDEFNYSLPGSDPLPSIELTGILITDEQVKDVLKTLDITKATGPNMINPRLLSSAQDTSLDCSQLLLHYDFHLSFDKNSITDVMY